MKDRVLMIHPSSDIPFLPPFEEFLRLSGFSAGMPGMIRDLGLQLGKVPPSDKTLKSAFTKPVTRSTANRIQDILAAKLPDNFDLLELSEKFKPWEDLKLRSNGASWFPAILSLREFSLRDRFPNSRAERFIHDRITAEYDCLEEIKRIALKPNQTKTDKALQEDVMKRLLHEHTFLDSNLIERASTVRMSDPERPRIEQQFWQDIRIEFYYSLLSNLSLDIMERFVELGIDSKGSDEMVSQGLMGILAPKREPDGQILYPFAQLLDRWKSVFSEDPNKPLTWRELSKAIPHQSDQEIAKLDPKSREYKDLWDIAMDTRKTRLKEWRSGVLPRDEQLLSFVENLLPENRDGHYAWLVAHLSLIWGRLIKQEMHRYETSGSLYDIEDGLLFRYQDIWKHYRDQAADILAT